MKITEINVIPKDFELTSPFVFASCTLKALPYAWVQVKTDEGITGYGECPAYWDPSGETQDSAIGAVNFIKGTLIEKSPFQLEQIMRVCDAEIYGAHSAKCGIDMALYDIMGKKLGVPVFDLLGGGNYNVKLNAVLGLASEEEAKEKAEGFAKRGFDYVKVKVGSDLDKEVAVLRALQGTLAKENRLFVDANQKGGALQKMLCAPSDDSKSSILHGLNNQ